MSTISTSACGCTWQGVPVYFTPRVEAIHHSGSSQANPLRIEWHKTRGFLRYFRLHYGEPRWWPLLAPLAAGILARLGVRAIRSLVRLAGGRLAPRGRQAASAHARPKLRVRGRTHPRGGGP